MELEGTPGDNWVMLTEPQFVLLVREVIVFHGVEYLHTSNGVLVPNRAALLLPMESWESNVAESFMHAARNTMIYARALRELHDAVGQFSIHIHELSPLAWVTFGPDDLPVRVEGDDESLVEKQHIEDLMDVIRDGDKAKYLEMATMLGVDQSRHEELWTGTRSRLGLSE